MSARPPAERLTKRQQEVLALLARGQTNYEIAQALGITLDGAKWHVREVLGRLGVESREDAAAIWRRESSLSGRLARGSSWLLHAGWTKLVVVAGVAGGAAIGGLLIISALKSDDGPATSSPDAPPTRAAAPRNAMVDAVIAVARAGDLAAFKALMRTAPEPCSNSGPVFCPKGTAEGTPVQSFFAAAGARVPDGPPLNDLLERTVPTLTILHGVVRAQPPVFSIEQPSTQFEVVFRGGSPIRAVSYFVNDTGIVGMHTDGLQAVNDALDTVTDDAWVIVRPAVATFAADRPLYVIGRDTEMRFDVRTPRACDGQDLALRLYVPPDPGLAGGVQTIREPGLTHESHRRASTSGLTEMRLPLPATISGPLQVIVAVDAYCLSQPSYQGLIALATSLPPADAAVAVFEVLGKSADLPTSDGKTFGERFGGSLTATVAGVACQTVSLVDPSLRNGRGNVEIRVGAPHQPPACNAPGEPISFVTATGTTLFEKPPFLAGVSQLIRNFSPEAPQ